MVRVTSGKQPHLAHLTQTRLSACFKKKKDAFQRLHLEWQVSQDYYACGFVHFAHSLNAHRRPKVRLSLVVELTFS